MSGLVSLFLEIFNMSLMGAAVIVVVCLVRLCLKKVPRKFSYWLWAVPAFRLACPFSFAAAFSLFRLSSVQTVGTAGPMTQVSYLPGIYEQVLRAAGDTSPAPAAFPIDARFPWNTLFGAAALLWLLGIAALLLWAAFSYGRLLAQVKTAVRFHGNVYECDRISSPFVLGIVRPKIYIPFGLTPWQRKYVICHEGCHIRRRDPLMKALAFLVLVVHWFNPAVWLAFGMMTRDMEGSCDEKALEKLGEDAREGYGRTLLSFAENRRFPTANPLAFGETGVKERIKRVMAFQRVPRWASAAAASACVLAAAVCLANPGAVGMIGGADGPTKIFVTGAKGSFVSSSTEDLAYQGEHISITQRELADYRDGSLEISEEDAVNTLAWRKIMAWRAYEEGIDFSPEEYLEKAEEMRTQMEKAKNYKETMEFLLKGEDITADQYWARLPSTAEFQRTVLGQAFLEKLREQFDQENAGKVVNWDLYLEEYRKNAVKDEHLEKVSP